MKNIKTLALFALTSIFLSACGDGTLQLAGKIHSFDYLGYKCWYITDKESNFNYEIITPDDFLLKEGMSVQMVAKKTDTETICKIGDRVTIVSYRIK